nr:uncharacterized protein LOC111426952 [Onthophagus taurus]
MRDNNGKLNGTDPQFIKLAAEKLNFTPVIRYTWDFGNKEPNGTITGAFGMLYNKEIDAIFGQIFTKDYHINEITFTNTISGDKLCVIVPKMEQKPKWLAIFATFQIEVWILIVTFVTTIGICLYFLRKFNSFTKNFSNLNHFHFNEFDTRFITLTSDTFRLVYNVAPNYLSRRPIEKIFLINFLFFALINTAAFQSSLSTVLTAPQYYKNLQSLEDLAKSQMRISSYSEGLRDTFATSEQPHIQVLNSRFSILPYTQNRYDAYLSRLTKTKYIQSLEVKTYGKLISHTIPDCPNSYLLSYLTRRDSLILDEINRIIEGCVESGLYNKWYNDVVGGAWNERLLENVETRAFTINDIQTAFYCLLLGYLLSIITFGLEYLNYI